MTKTELVKAVAEEAGVSNVQADKFMDALIAVVTKTLIAKEEVKISGFLSFEPVAKAARTGRNPKTGVDVPIAASTRVKVSVGATLKKAVKKS